MNSTVAVPQIVSKPSTAQNVCKLYFDFIGDVCRPVGNFNLGPDDYIDFTVIVYFPPPFNGIVYPKNLDTNEWLFGYR